MKYSVRLTAAARRDLADAFDYMDQTLKNPVAADAFVEHVSKGLSSLCTFPERCALVRDPLLSALGIRFLRIQSYVAFFRVEDTAAAVHVLRVLYGRSDWAALLRNDLLRS